MVREALWLVMLFVMVLPPVGAYYDEYIYPKWIWGSVCLLLFAIYSLLVGHTERKALLTRYSYTIVACYVCVCIFLSTLSNHTFAGSIPFENASVMALHLCMLIPLAQSELTRCGKIVRYVIATLVLLGVFMSQSRTALVCLSVYIAFQFNYKKKAWHILSISAILILILGLIFFVKTDSSKGRFFILKNSIELVEEKPLLGHGSGAFQREYMCKQREYFETHPNSGYTMLADDIHHPLNEYLRVTVEYGILGLCMFAYLLFFPFYHVYRRCKKQSSPLELSRYPLLLSLISVCIFAFFSYPLLYPMSWLIIAMNWYGYVVPASCKVMDTKLRWTCVVVSIVLLIVVGVVDYQYRRWGKVSNLAKQGYPTAMMRYYTELYTYLCHNHLFLYDYAIESYRANRLAQADNLLVELSKKEISYEATLLHGDVCQHLGDYERATCYYTDASNMCPCRFAPLYGMWQVNIEKRNLKMAKTLADSISKKKVKIESKEIYFLKEDIKKTMNTLMIDGSPR